MYFMFCFIKNNLLENSGLGNWKIKLFILKYIGVGILVRLVMVEEIINNFLNFDIEVNIWIYLKVNNKLNL